MYEISYFEPGQDFPTSEEFDFLDDAVDAANAKNAIVIVDLETLEDWTKCKFCGEWYPSDEIGVNGCCDYCNQEFESRGETFI